MTINRDKWSYEQSHASHLTMVLMVDWLLNDVREQPLKDWHAFINAFPNLPFDAYERAVATADRFKRRSE